MDLFGIGLPELILILLLAFVIFGPGRIVEISREAGKMMRSLSREAYDARRKLEEELTADNTKPPRTESEGDRKG